MEALAFLIGKTTSDHLEIRLAGRSAPLAQDYWDGNWVNASVSMRAGGFKGGYDLCLRTTDFVELLEGFRRLSADLGATVQFQATEEQIEFSVHGDGRGHFNLGGMATDKAGIGNRLTFELQFDQTEIAAIARSLEAIVAACPVVGAAEA